MHIDHELLNQTDRRIMRLIRIAPPLNVDQIAEILGIPTHEAGMSLAFLCGLGAITANNNPTFTAIKK